MSEYGKFITVEGVEGAGKSTQLSFIVDHLRSRHIDLLQTREQGGTELSEEIRELLLRPREAGMSHKAELMLMFAARAEHLERTILPALEAGTWVICDRFTDATYAYQGGGRGLPVDWIQALEKLTQGNRQPDYTLFLDLPVETGLERAGKRGSLDRFEQEDMAFFDRVRSVYLQRASDNPTRFRVIDAAPGIEQVQAQISQILDQILQG